MKEFLSELLYMCSASNTKGTRGFYIGVTAMLALLTLGLIASIVLLVLNIVLYGAFKILFLALALVALAIEIIVIVWLKKS